MTFGEIFWPTLPAENYVEYLNSVLRYKYISKLVSSTTALFIVIAVRSSNTTQNIPRLGCGARGGYRELSVATKYRLGDPEEWV